MLCHAAKCILQWAELREDCSCPQCKKPFSRLLTYRTLDGTMSDFPVEESICLLKRANWVQDQLKVKSLWGCQHIPADVLCDAHSKKSAMLRHQGVECSLACKAAMYIKHGTSCQTH